MPKVPCKEGGFYSSYASGNGAIQFTHENIKGEATGEPVPLYIAIVLMPDGWKLTDHNGNLEAYAPVQRVNDILELNGTLYRYGVAHEGNGWRRYWFKDAEDDGEVKNVSTCAALTYFLENEGRLKAPI